VHLPCGCAGRDADALQLAQACEKLGAGEILLNCIDKDGTNSSFDIERLKHISEGVSIPVIASSGAGKVENFSEVFAKKDVEAALAAGIFHLERGGHQGRQIAHAGTEGGAETR
jgi:glutamine amidotransferase/cyclase